MITLEKPNYRKHFDFVMPPQILLAERLLQARFVSNKTTRHPEAAFGSVSGHHRIPELSNLPKSPTKLRSLRVRGPQLLIPCFQKLTRIPLKFNRVLPGRPDSLVSNGKRWNLSKLVDPSHPSVTRSEPRDFPSFSTSLFRLRAFPCAVLDRFAADACFPFEDGYPRTRKFKLKTGSHQNPGSSLATSPGKGMPASESERVPFPNRSIAPMGLVNVLGKKSVHSSAVVRVRIKLRMKEALRLVVARGATVDPHGTIILDQEPIGEASWLMEGLQAAPRSLLTTN